MESIQPKILVLDDEPEYLDLVDSILKENNFDVEIAHSPELCLNQAKEAKPDVILVEVNLGKMNGYQVCRALKHDHKTRSIPVCFMSCLSGKDIERNSLEAGGECFIGKPFTKDQLVETVNQYLSIHRQISNTSENYIWIRKDGIGFYVLRSDSKISLDEANENTSLFLAMTGAKRIPLLIDVRECVSRAGEIQRYYGKKTTCTALALLIDSPLKKLLYNFKCKLFSLTMPIRFFTREDKAFEWLRKYKTKSRCIKDKVIS